MQFIKADVSVIGLGKLGASMVAGMANRGISIIGVDVIPASVEAVNKGMAPVEETDLGKTLNANIDKIRATLDYTDAVHNTPISFVIVPTPSNKQGDFSLKYAAQSFMEIGKALRTKKDYHVIVLTSTVLPGSVRYGLLPILEKESGKKCGKDFGLCYNPEFIALGSIIKDFLNPDFYLVGEFDQKSGDILEAVHNRVSVNKAPVKRMSIENAEIAKIAVNSFVTLKISYSNILADICERIPGGDVDVVSDAIGTDSRIGKKYLKGGVGFGGPCFPRDNVALNFLGAQIGAETNILRVNDEYNRSISMRLINRLKDQIPASGKAAVLGLSYKPFSHIVEEATGMGICRTLYEKGYRVSGYDPLAGNEALNEIGNSINIETCVEKALEDADMVFVTTPDPTFISLTPHQLISPDKKTYVVDFWRCLNKSIQNHADIVYIPGGRCINPEPAKNKLFKMWAEIR